jgi:hypothetical protein
MNQTNRPILSFIGVVLLLLGLYGAFRTLVNLIAFERYPQEAVFSLSSFQSDYTQREEDCATTYAYSLPIYYQSDNVTPRKATAEEAKSDAAYAAQQEQNKENCVTGLQEIRKAAMVSDISHSIIFLLLALGVLFHNRIFKKPLTQRI